MTLSFSPADTSYKYWKTYKYITQTRWSFQSFNFESSLLTGWRHHWDKLVKAIEPWNCFACIYFMICLWNEMVSKWGTLRLKVFIYLFIFNQSCPHVATEQVVHTVYPQLILTHAQMDIYIKQWVNVCDGTKKHLKEQVHMH